MQEGEVIEQTFVLHTLLQMMLKMNDTATYLSAYAQTQKSARRRPFAGNFHSTPTCDMLSAKRMLAG